MRKIPATLFAILTGLSLMLSACHVTPAPLPGPTPGVTAPAPAETPAPQKTVLPSATAVPPEFRIDPAELRAVEVRFWHPFTGETGRKVSEMITAFNRENVWGIQVSESAAGGQSALFDRMTAALEEKSMPSILAAPVDQLAYWQTSLVDLTAYVNSSEWGLTAEEIADFYPTFWQQDVLNGTRLGIPAERSARVLFYNTAWARELGFSRPPKTPAEFQQQACSAMQALVNDGDKTNDGMGGWVIDREAETLFSWMLAFGAPVPDETSQSYEFNTRQAASAFAFIRQMFDKSCAWLSRNPQPYEYFATRQALFFAGDLSEIPVQERYQARSNNQDAWTVLPFPGEQGEAVLVAGGPSYALVKSKPVEQLASWLFLRWMILHKNQLQMVRAGLTLPLTLSLGSGVSSDAHWRVVLPYLDQVQPAPRLSSWWMARNILEDAGWQMLQPTPLPPATILKQVDETLAEVLQHRP